MGHAIIKVMSFSVDVWNTIENRGVNSDMETQHIIHNFEPIYNEHSKILMLGTMPSPKPEKSDSTMDTQETDSGKLYPMSVAKRIRRREKARSHLH